MEPATIRSWTLENSRIFACALLVGAALPAMAQRAPEAVKPNAGVATPHEIFGPLFEAVQAARIYPDAKTFADAVANEDPQTILAQYRREQPKDAAALKAFVERYFSLPAPTTVTLRQHIASLWPVLTRPPLDPPKWSSALALPANYVVPGGRFRASRTRVRSLSLIHI